MDFKNSQEIIEKYQILSQQKKAYENTIKQYKESKKRANIKQRKYLNSLLRECYYIVDEYTKQMNDCIDIFNKNSSFPSGQLIEFIKECLELFEGKEYNYTHVVFTESLQNLDNYVANITVNYLIYEKCYENEINEIKNTFIIHHLSHYYKECLKGSKYILKPTGDTETLVSISGLLSYLKNFPYLEEIGYNLVDRRLLEPEKSLQDILKDELVSIKNKETKTLKKEVNI